MKPPVKGKPALWESFEHILLFVSLAIVAVALGQTLHTFVDRWTPTIGDRFSLSRYMTDVNKELLQWYLAALIVGYPLFSLLFLDVARRTIAKPELRSLTARRVVIYATLVVTFLHGVFKIITLTVGFLGGNLTTNSLLHIAVTVGINSVIFVYYVNQIREDRAIYE